MHDSIKARRKVMDFAEKQTGKGWDEATLATALIQTGLSMLRDGQGKPITQAIVARTDHGSVTITTPMPEFTLAVVPINDNRNEILEIAGQQFLYYEEQHRAKMTAVSSDKADVNLALAAMCFRPTKSPIERRPVRLSPSWHPDMHLPWLADVKIPGIVLGEREIAGILPPKEPQESDSGLPAPDGAPKLSGDPLDRQEALGWLDMKIAGAKKSSMPETVQVLTAIKADLAQHLEAAPIDIEGALRAHYDDVFARNEKAGWWNDLATNEPKKRSVGELFMLIVTELAEAYDAYRANAADDKLPQYPGMGVELGDIDIRLADFCGALRAGRIVEHTFTRNPGAALFEEVCDIAHQYERIRKTPEAVGDVEQGEPLAPQDVAEMITAKLAFNAQRADHKPENRKLEGGKQT